MKKALSVLLTLVMILALCSMAVFAAPGSDTVTGILHVNSSGTAVTGILSGTTTSLDLALSATGGVAGQWASFTGTVGGTFTGTVTAKINWNGYDTMFAVITVGSNTYYLTSTNVGEEDDNGYFPVTGSFFLANPVIPDVTSITLDPITVYGGHPSGSVYMDLNATVAPSGYSGPLFWSVWVSSTSGASVSITQTGLLTINDIGSGFTVIANTLDPTLKSQNFTFGTDYATAYSLSFDEGTEVTADADVSYVVVIPSSVDFGTIYRDTGVKTKDFAVSVENALVEVGSTVKVTNTTADMNMYAGSKTLPFTLAQTGGIFNFAAADLTDGEQTIFSSVSCNTANLQVAGSYVGYMTFTVDYQSVV